MCRKAVGKVEGEVKGYWEMIGNAVEDGMNSEKKADIIRDKFCTIVKE